MFVHDLIKINLIENGYLPDYPYHLISDAEMIDAFMGKKHDNYFGQDFMIGYFVDNYPTIAYNNTTEYKNLRPAYDNLVLSIYCYLQLYLLHKANNELYTIPDWVYSYMLGQVISINSDKLDIHDLITPLGVDNISDDYNADCALAVFDESVSWIQRVGINSNIAVPTKYKTALEYKLQGYYITVRGNNLFTLFQNGTQYPDPANPDPSLPDYNIWNRPSETMCTRPPTLFGEPHVIKSIRIR